MSGLARTHGPSTAGGPVSPEIRRSLAAIRLAIANGRLQEARDGLRALEGDPSLAAAHALRLSSLAQQEGEVGRQTEWAVKAADAWSEASVDPLLAHVQALLAVRNEPGALDAFERLADRHPEKLAIIFGRARLAQWEGRRAEALDLMEEALALAPEMWPIHLGRLDLLLTERPAAADDALALIETIWPTGMQRHIAAAKMHLARDEFEQAIGAAEAIQPTTAVSLRMLALALTGSRRIDDALGAVDELIALNPADGLRLSARILTGAGRLDDAIAVVRKHLALTPNASDLRVQEARLLARVGREAEAERLLRDLVTERPEDPSLRVALAGQVEENGKADEALALLTGIPRTGEVRARLWRLLARLGHHDLLRSDLERAPLDGLPPTKAIVRAAQALVQGSEDELAIALLTRAIETTREGEASSAGSQSLILECILTFALAYMPSAEIEERIAALGTRLSTSAAHRVHAQALDRGGEVEAALQALRRLPTAERRERDVATIARLLHDRHRRALALRYLSVHARTWPGLWGTIIKLHVEQGKIEEAGKQLEAIPVHSLSGMARRKTELHLDIQAGRTKADAALLDATSEKSFSFMTQPILRQALARGEVDLAEKAWDRLLMHQKARHSHWSSSLEGQLLADLRFAETTLGSEGLKTLGSGPLRDLARVVVAHPQLYAPAAILISRIGPYAQGSVEAVDSRDEVGTELDAPSETGLDPSPIPLNVYQYWNDDPPPAPVSSVIKSWADASNVTHELLNRRTAQRWLHTIGPRWDQAFRMANNPAEEADFLRLCILWQRGGVWADADDRLLGDVERLIAGSGLIVFQEPVGWGISNNVIASNTQHPVMAYAAETARRDLLGHSNESTWQKTGPGLLTRAVAQYAARTIVRSGILPADMSIRPQAVLRREVGIHTRLPHKSDASYWNFRRSSDPGYGALLDQATAG